MSGGLNNEFMDDPEAFMRKHPVDIPPYDHLKKISPLTKLPDGGGPAAGLQEFDLWFDPSTGLVNVLLFADTPGDDKKPEKPLPAFWLPWNPDGEASVTFATLNDAGAAYLFTHSLAGCRILMTETTFTHISGQLSQKGRQAMTDELIQGGRARAFSSTTGNKYGDGAFIIGHRAKTGRFFKKRVGAWEFVAQSSEMKFETKRYAIQKIWDNNDLYLIGQ